MNAAGSSENAAVNSGGQGTPPGSVRPSCTMVCATEIFR